MFDISAKQNLKSSGIKHFLQIINQDSFQNFKIILRFIKSRASGIIQTASKDKSPGVSSVLTTFGQQCCAHFIHTNSSNSHTCLCTLPLLRMQQNLSTGTQYSDNQWKSPHLPLFSSLLWINRMIRIKIEVNQYCSVREISGIGMPGKLYRYYRIIYRYYRYDF